MYKNNRNKLRQALGKEELIIICAPFEIQAIHDITYKFQQDASFFWLTGIESPGWKLVIDGKSNQEYLIAPNRDETDVIFNGSQSFSEIQSISSIDSVIDINEANQLLTNLLNKYEKVYSPASDPYDKYLSAVINPSYKINKRWINKYFKTVINCRPELNKLRAIKSDDEIKLIRQAISITAQAFNKAKQVIASATTENELLAEFDYTFRRNGVTYAYEPIVASGVNALTLHYVKNNQPLVKNGLTVIDIGASYNGYAADITRTFATGSISKRQAEVHEAVKNAQTAIIELIAPGVKFADYQRECDAIMKKTLQNLGLLPDINDEKIYRKYFPHAVSHGLGIDVHESLGGFTEFKEGMLLTVEPGIYVAEEGIGVRIEDDILVTNTGNENLSVSLTTSL